MSNMNEPVASNDSNDSEVSFNGFLVSKNRKLANKQIKEINSLKAHTIFGVCPNEEQKRLWNGLMKKKRYNTKLLRLATHASQHFEFNVRQGVSWSEWLQRLNHLHFVDEIVLETTNNKGRINKYSMLAWLGANLNNFADLYLYQGKSLASDIKTLYPKIDEVDLLKIVGEFNRIGIVHKYLLRIKNSRERSSRNSSNENSFGILPMRQRYNAIISNIASVHPLRWTRALPYFQQKMANRIRPEGECLGIELEFLASSNAEIVNWDSDDYHNQPFLQFKGDGSISTSNSSEALARYQELTYFMNSKSKDDWMTLKQVLNDMVKAGAKINSSCGNHVHLDMRHRSHSSSMRTASKVRDAINTWAHRLVSYSRSHNSYCGINREYQGNRYTAVNIQCLGEHNTVEVRLGMPTLNYYKLVYWSKFLQYLATPRTNVATFEDFMQSDAPVDLKHYAFKRILRFQDTYVTNGLNPLHNFDSYSNAFCQIDGSVE